MLAIRAQVMAGITVLLATSEQVDPDTLRAIRQRALEMLASTAETPVMADAADLTPTEEETVQRMAASLMRYWFSLALQPSLPN
jgi:hypothetical protein